jgi:hypothetical protein
MTIMEKPDFDLFELTHIDEVTRRRVVNDDVTGELRQKVVEYLDAIEPPTFDDIELLNPKDDA